MEIIGRIHSINETEVITASFKKREFVVETQEQYPQKILIQVTQDKVALLEEYSKGDEVEVSINIRGREWINPEGVAKYFNTIEGWRIKRQEGTSKPAGETKQENSNKINTMLAESNYSNGMDDDDDDLPF